LPPFGKFGKSGWLIAEISLDFPFNIFILHNIKDMNEDEIQKLFATENEHLKKLNQIVSDAMKEEELIVSNLLHPPQDVLSRGQRLSDKVASFGGSWMFIISFGFVLMAWIVFNIVMPEQKIFDPYPFILMNLVLSTIAALQAPIIMMSQNRKEEKDRKRAENDYLINLKAELELRSLHQKIDLMLGDQVKTIFDMQVKQMEMLNQISRKLEALPKK
jgi:uncharacterized membrane protein